MISLKDITEMRERIRAVADRAKKELHDAQEELAALDVIERRIQVENEPPPSMTLPGVEPAGADTRSIPFAQAVREAVLTIKGMQFTVLDVEEILRRSNLKLPPKNLRTRITLELIPLVNKGVLSIAHRGSGKTPNRYRLVDLAEMGASAGNGEGADRVSGHTPSVTNLQH